jgi:iron complex outermembrane recepter protein
MRFHVKPASGIAAALILVPLLAGVRPARSQPSTASITGAVVSLDGAGLPGSAVTVTPADGSSAVRVVAGERGVFRVRSLAAGTYAVRAEATGFAPTSLPAFPLAAGESREVTLSLVVSTVRDAVTVVADSPRDSVEAAEIRESSARDVGEALSATPGVWKLRKGGIANEVVVRGFQSANLNVLIDGQRINGACPSHMDPPSFHADFAEVDRIEVGKGPFDVKNEGGLGGTVNIVTRQPEAGWHATANLAGGSAGYVNPSATVSYGSGAVSALAGFSWRSSEAYRDGSGMRFTELTNYKASETEAAAFEVGTAWGKVRFAPLAGHAAEIAWTHQEANHVFYPYLKMDSPWDRSDRVGFSYDIAGGVNTASSLKFTGYYTQVDHWMTDQYRTSAGMAALGYSMATMANSRTVGGKLQATLFSEVTAGVEAFHRFWETVNQMSMMGSYTTSYALPGATSDVAGVYADWKHPLSGTVSLVAGARFDWVSGRADPAKANTNLYYAYNGTRSTSYADAFPSGSVRVVFQPSVGTEISGGLGTKVRVAEPNELYYALKRTGTDWVGNPALSPSRNTGLDVAASIRRSGLYAALSLFANRVSDFVSLHDQTLVIATPGIVNTSARSYANVDATLLGGELTAVATLTDRIFLSGDVSYVRGSQEARPEIGITSTNLAEMPPLRGRLGLRYDTGRFWAEAEGVFSAAQTRVDSDLEETPTAGWGIANLRLGANVGGLALTAGIANVFDRLYYESLSYQRDPYRSGVKVPEPGRTFFANVGWRF